MHKKWTSTDKKHKKRQYYTNLKRQQIVSTLGKYMPSFPKGDMMGFIIIR